MGLNLCCRPESSEENLNCCNRNLNFSKNNILITNESIVNQIIKLNVMITLKNKLEKIIDYDYSYSHRLNDVNIKHKKRLIVQTEGKHKKIHFFSFGTGNILYYLSSIKINSLYYVKTVKFLDQKNSHYYTLIVENKHTKENIILIISFDKIKSNSHLTVKKQKDSDYLEENHSNLITNIDKENKNKIKFFKNQPNFSPSKDRTNQSFKNKIPHLLNGNDPFMLYENPINDLKEKEISNLRNKDEMKVKINKKENLIENKVNQYEETNIDKFYNKNIDFNSLSDEEEVSKKPFVYSNKQFLFEEMISSSIESEERNILLEDYKKNIDINLEDNDFMGTKISNVINNKDKIKQKNPYQKQNKKKRKIFDIRINNEELINNNNEGNKYFQELDKKSAMNVFYNANLDKYRLYSHIITSVIIEKQSKNIIICDNQINLHLEEGNVNKVIKISNDFQGHSISSYHCLKNYDPINDYIFHINENTILFEGLNIYYYRCDELIMKIKFHQLFLFDYLDYYESNKCQQNQENKISSKLIPIKKCYINQNFFTNNNENIKSESRVKKSKISLEIIKISYAYMDKKFKREQKKQIPCIKNNSSNNETLNITFKEMSDMYISGDSLYDTPENKISKQDKQLVKSKSSAFHFSPIHSKDEIIQCENILRTEISSESEAIIDTQSNIHDSNEEILMFQNENNNFYISGLCFYNENEFNSTSQFLAYVEINPDTYGYDTKSEGKIKINNRFNKIRVIENISLITSVGCAKNIGILLTGHIDSLVGVWDICDLSLKCICTFDGIVSSIIKISNMFDQNCIISTRCSLVSFDVYNDKIQEVMVL